jgi:hypothetical protein
MKYIKQTIIDKFKFFSDLNCLKTLELLLEYCVSIDSYLRYRQGTFCGVSFYFFNEAIGITA